jgi:hypothetical protein
MQHVQGISPASTASGSLSEASITLCFPTASFPALDCAAPSSRLLGNVPSATDVPGLAGAGAGAAALARVPNLALVRAPSRDLGPVSGHAAPGLPARAGSPTVPSRLGSGELPRPCSTAGSSPPPSRRPKSLLSMQLRESGCVSPLRF